MFLRRHWSSACSVSRYAGGCRPKHTLDLWCLRFPFNFLIRFLINVLNYKKYCWIKYESWGLTSGLTGGIFFKSYATSAFNNERSEPERCELAYQYINTCYSGTLIIISPFKSIWYRQLTFSWPFTQFPFQVRNVIIWSTIFVQLNKPCYCILGNSIKVINVFLYYFWTHDFWSNTLSYSVPFFSIPTISKQQNK